MNQLPLLVHLEIASVGAGTALTLRQGVPSRLGGVPGAERDRPGMILGRLAAVLGEGG